MLVRRSARFVSLLSGLVLLIGGVACGKSGSSTPVLVGAPATLVGTPLATPIDADFRLTGVDPSRLCYNASTLPANFVPDGNGLWGTVADAAASSVDPTDRAQKLQTWGYVTGAYSQWSLSAASAPTKQQEQTLPPGTIAALQSTAEAETNAAPYISTLCQVFLYQHTDGAHQAFANTYDELKSMQAITAADPNSALRKGDHTSIGNESASYFADASRNGSVIVVFRTGNVVGEASVTYFCSQDCAATSARLEPEAVRLATLINGTIDQTLSR